MVEEVIIEYNNSNPSKWAKVFCDKLMELFPEIFTELVVVGDEHYLKIGNTDNHDWKIGSWLDIQQYDLEHQSLATRTLYNGNIVCLEPYFGWQNDGGGNYKLKLYIIRNSDDNILVKLGHLDVNQSTIDKILFSTIKINNELCLLTPANESNIFTTKEKPIVQLSNGNIVYGSYSELTLRENYVFPHDEGKAFLLNSLIIKGINELNETFLVNDNSYLYCISNNINAGQVYKINNIRYIVVATLGGNQVILFKID